MSWKITISLFLVCFAFLLVAGCSTNSPNFGDQTPISTPTFVTPTVISVNHFGDQTLITTPTLVSSTAISNSHFEGSGISFAYPTSFTPMSSATIQNMQSALKSSGAELITMLSSRDGSAYVQVARQSNPTTITTLYNDKKNFADSVSKDGYTINGIKFVRYDIELVTSKNGKQFVRGYAEQESGKVPVAVSYMFINSNYEYNINFIYSSATQAQSQPDTRDSIIDSLKFL